MLITILYICVSGFNTYNSVFQAKFCGNDLTFFYFVQKVTPPPPLPRDISYLTTLLSMLILTPNCFQCYENSFES